MPSTPIESVNVVNVASVNSSDFKSRVLTSDVNLVGSFGRTVLHEIAAMGNWIAEEEVAAFGSAALEACARFDRRDDDLNSTPLGWACRWGRIELVKLLLAHGADPEEADAEPWARPIAWARKRRHREIADILTQST